MKKELHIVCAGIPWPADNSAAIDILQGIKTFHTNDVVVHLHCISNAETVPYELNALCGTVRLYPFQKSGLPVHRARGIPDCILSKINSALITELNKDRLPVLFQGLYTTGNLQHIDPNGRKICIRIQTEGSKHHQNLAKHTYNPFKWLHHKKESRLIKKYYKTLPQNCLYAFVCKRDRQFFEQNGFSNSCFVPAFTGWQKVTSKPGTGSFCLFHGNLSQPENVKVAFWLLRNVFNKIKIPFVIAGKAPSLRLQQAAHVFKHTCIVANPPEEELNDLIYKAHINILPGFNENRSGVSLKLLHAIFEGRHCVATPAMAFNPELKKICHVGPDADTLANIVEHLYDQPFEAPELALREDLLANNYNNQKNIAHLINYLW